MLFFANLMYFKTEA